MDASMPESARRRARSPHELSMINLLMINLLLLIAVLAGSFLPQGSALLEYRWWLVAGPLSLSLAVILFTHWKANQLQRETGSQQAFIAAHWRLAVARNRILLLAYLVGASLIGVGWLLSMSQADPRMEALMFVALQRVAVAPVLLTLMVLIMLEAGALYQAGRGELPAAKAPSSEPQGPELQRS
ncbi:hypothetical protein [Motiliproteus coralliicola]|nr:hypothetical protein [Motiliproteus coralliicola]